METTVKEMNATEYFGRLYRMCKEQWLNEEAISITDRQFTTLKNKVKQGGHNMQGEDWLAIEIALEENNQREIIEYFTRRFDLQKKDYNHDEGITYCTQPVVKKYGRWGGAKHK